MRQKIARLAERGRPRVLDLFAGCGGLSLGFHAAGFDIVAAVESDPDAAASHGANFHPGAPAHAVPRDITALKPSDLVRELHLGPVRSAGDVLVGGPPARPSPVSGKSSRVGGRPDLRHAFGREEYEALRAADRASKEDELREAMPAPLLVLYLLRGVQAAGPGTEAAPYRDGLLLPALGMHFPGAPDLDAPRHLVRYRLNRVAQRELLPEGEVEDDDVAEDDDDVD